MKKIVLMCFLCIAFTIGFQQDFLVFAAPQTDIPVTLTSQMKVSSNVL